MSALFSTPASAGGRKGGRRACHSGHPVFAGVQNLTPPAGTGKCEFPPVHGGTKGGSAFILHPSSLILLFGLAVSSLAAELSGTVRDFATGRAIAHAEIRLAPLDRQAFSDARGRFELVDLPAGRHVITVSKEGYHPYIFEQTFDKESERATVDIELEPSVEGETTAEHVQEEPRYKLPEITVLTSRAAANDPVTFTNLTQKDVGERSYGQDLPLLFTELPNVTAYSDGGNGIGYSYLRMRGFGQDRVAVQVNGTPLNDAGTGEVFWIDLPDFASDVQDIQVQRGVGSSFYGPAAFGGTINVVTRTPGLDPNPSLRAEGTLGAWNTRRAMVSSESGRIQNRYGISGHLTRMMTDGYREGSWADLWSYYLSGARFTEKHTTRLAFYGGPEKTHLAYEGITKEEMAADRRFNPLTYPGEIDNFFQPHYELHDEWRLTEGYTLDNSLYLFRGDGYYDQWRTDQKPYKYFFSDSLPDTRINLLRRRNVGETDGGWIPHLSIEHGWGETTLGGELRLHEAQHQGRIVWSDYAPASVGPDYSYYDYRIRKESVVGYVHNLSNITSHCRGMLDLQLRHLRYRMDRDRLWNVGWHRGWTFLAPRVGLSYELLSPMESAHRPSAVVYASVSQADREPAYKDIYDPQDYDGLRIHDTQGRFFRVQPTGGYRYIGPGVVPEQMLNYEAGTNWQWRNLRAGANVYWIRVHDEIVPYGTQNDLGQFVSVNAPKTLHQGVEFIASCSPLPSLKFTGNLALTDHHFVRYRELVWQDTGYVPVSRNGNRIAFDPPYVGNLRAEYSRWNFRCALSLQALGKQYVDNSENDDTAVPAYALLNADFAYRFAHLAGTAKTVELRLRINNLLDREFESFGYMNDDGDPVYMVGAPRAAYTTLAVEL
jgi:iron complex outermembrane receptor protein